MTKFSEITSYLELNQYNWVITGVAGFIGSNLLEYLLENNQRVTGIDNFSTGKAENLDLVNKAVGSKLWQNFSFHELDINNFEAYIDLFNGIDFVLHQAALGSVPRSIKDPISTNMSNINGFLNIIEASRLSRVKNFVFAASSSTYGDHPDLPKMENKIGKPLSPYAVTKYVNELYADVYSRVYGFRSVGLRYFNVFGRRQDPSGAYAAVIPKWIGAMINDEDIYINGDGSTSRDFCFINNAVQANIIAALDNDIHDSRVYNVAVGNRTNLNKLFNSIKSNLHRNNVFYNKKPIYRDFRDGDVLHSQADISKISNEIGYNPEFNLEDGLKMSVDWYIEKNNIRPKKAEHL